MEIARTRLGAWVLSGVVGLVLGCGSGAGLWGPVLGGGFCAGLRVLCCAGLWVLCWAVGPELGCRSCVGLSDGGGQGGGGRSRCLVTGLPPLA